LRRDIVPAGADSLSYEIREIVVIAEMLEKMGLKLTHENIGDPIAKNEKVEPWIRDEIKKLLDMDISWGYCNTQGIPATRDFLAERTNSLGGIKITRDDIYFFNGLGDAVAKIFGFLKREARVIGPTPAYSTHSSAEAAHSGYEHLTYKLDPDNNWEPDIDEIYNKAKYNDSIAGILTINPHNPTGSTISRSGLKRICEIAEELDLFIICDEIYSELVYSSGETTRLAEVIGNACGISLRGISKEIPWPGSRCGWMEVYNKHKDPQFAKYIETILKAKRLEVCSTTLPQMSIPYILGHEKYPYHLKMRTAKYEKRALEAKEIFGNTKGIKFIQPRGAFYMAILFEDNVINNTKKLKIEPDEIRVKIEELCNGKNIADDKRFVYYLLGATGIITVPLTSFYSKINGIRLTLLEEHDDKRREVFTLIRDKMVEFINS
jgi:alanine-synthesizing transaminase